MAIARPAYLDPGQREAYPTSQTAGVPLTPSNRAVGTDVMGASGIPTSEIKSRYYMLSCDNHLNGPPDLFEKRVDKRFRHRLPRQEVDDNGVKWSITEGLRPGKIRDFKLSGEDKERSAGGSFDWEKRWTDHTRDGVDAEVVFPGGGGLMAWATPDPLLSRALCAAQNDWYYEVVGDHFNRTMPAALIAPSNVDEAIKEVARVANLGFRAINIPVRPFHASAGAKSDQVGYNSPMFEPLWSAIEDADITLTCHVATGKDPRTASGEGGAVINYVTHALTPAIEPFTHFCASGILERHPKLRFGTVESGIGFLPWVMSGMDEAYEKHHFWVFPKLKMLPSEYFRQQCFATFQEDPAGMLLAPTYQIIKNACWGSDYPHHEGSWPHSDEAIARTMGHLSEDERRDVLGLNAARLFGFEVPEQYSYDINGNNR